MSYIPPSNIDVTRNVLFCEEPSFGTVQTNATWKNAGIANSLTWKKSPQHQAVDILGSVDSYGEYKFGNDYTVEIKYYLLDVELLKYGTELPNGTGTIEKSLTILVTKKINNVESFRVFKGCITESCTYDFSKIPMVTQTFRASNISDWLDATEAAAVIGASGSITYPGALSADPWTSLDVGSSNLTYTQPLSINSVPYDVAKFTFTVSRNILILQPLAAPDPTYIKAGRRKITAALTTWPKDNGSSGNILENMVDSFSPYNMTFQMKYAATTPAKATFANTRLVSVAGGEDAGATTFDTFDYTAIAKTVTVNATTP